VTRATWRADVVCGAGHQSPERLNKRSAGESVPTGGASALPSPFVLQMRARAAVSGPWSFAAPFAVGVADQESDEWARSAIG
jgi:hypothetical protein